MQSLTFLLWPTSGLTLAPRKHLLWKFCCMKSGQVIKSPALSQPSLSGHVPGTLCVCRWCSHLQTAHRETEGKQPYLPIPGVRYRDRCHCPYCPEETASCTRGFSTGGRQRPWSSAARLEPFPSPLQQGTSICSHWFTVTPSRSHSLGVKYCRFSATPSVCPWGKLLFCQ
jgi:hypothetical protein